MIETREAVESVDDILAVPGIDAVYIGPADLSITYGLPPGARQPGDAASTSALDDGGRGVRASRRRAGHPLARGARRPRATAAGSA